MSVVDVGDQVEQEFTTSPSGAVTVTWIAPDGVTVIDRQPVREAEPGVYRYTFTPTMAGVWEARWLAPGTSNGAEQMFVRAMSVTVPPLATVGEVQELYGTLTAAQVALTGALLRRASSMLRARFPDLDVRVGSGRIAEDAPGMAAVNMVLRVLRNPGGLRSETTGPFTRAYDTKVAAGLLVVSDTEEALLDPQPASRSSSRAGTIRVQAGLAAVAWRRWRWRHGR